MSSERPWSTDSIEAPGVLAMDVRGFSLWIVDETLYRYVWTLCLDNEAMETMDILLSAVV